MDRSIIFENAQTLNKFMTNERILYRVNDLTLELLWTAFPDKNEKSIPHAEGQRHVKSHSHSFCETHLCTQGTVIYRLTDGRDYTINAGDTIFIRENVEHEQVYASQDALKISMAYRLMENQSLYNRPDKKTLLDVVVIPQADHIFELYRLLSEELQELRLGYKEMIGSLLFQITMEYERQISAAPSEDSVIQRIDRRADEIENFINANLSTNITTMDVADVLHLSKRQINRIVFKEFGTSCCGLIKQLKHKKAQEYLLYSDKSVQEIATTLGYGSVYSFSKFFKSQEGMPPALFRRSHYSY